MNCIRFLFLFLFFWEENALQRVSWPLLAYDHTMRSLQPRRGVSPHHAGTLSSHFQLSELWWINGRCFATTQSVVYCYSQTNGPRHFFSDKKSDAICIFVSPSARYLYFPLASFTIFYLSFISVVQNDFLKRNVCQLSCLTFSRSWTRGLQFDFNLEKLSVINFFKYFPCYFLSCAFGIPFTLMLHLLRLTHSLWIFWSSFPVFVLFNLFAFQVDGDILMLREFFFYHVQSTNKQIKGTLYLCYDVFDL